MDRWHWLWALGFLNSLSIVLLVWRNIVLRMRVDGLRDTQVYLVQGYLDHVHGKDLHQPQPARTCKEA